MGILKHPKVQWLKRIVFGRKDPNQVLKWTCLLLFWWSVLVLILFVGLGLMQMFLPSDSSYYEGLKELKDQGPAFFFIYAGCHLISMISIALIYRLKIVGILIYAIISMLLVFLPMIYWSEFLTESLIFTLICIILFTVHLGSMGKKENAKDDDDPEIVEAEIIELDRQ
ncbi:MAG: hypothetical protein ACI9J3_000340 [Parvicellaceae bacterium]|jgi:hypothetical protein